MSFLKATIVGNLGRDPELKYTPQGKAVCSFSLAVNSKEDGSSVTTWVKITLWNKRAETASKYLVKGQSVYIEGRLKLDEWMDKEGNPKTTLSVTGTDMQFISNRRDVTDDDSTIGMKREEPLSGNVNTEDIPF